MLPYPRANLHITQGLCLKNQNLYLDRVSTGSGSDLVSDQHATFLMIRDAYGWTRSLPLPVLTRPTVGSDSLRQSHREVELTPSRNIS